MPENYDLTQSMLGWLKEIYLKAAREHREAASNNHIWALGCKTNEEAAEFEAYAEDNRYFADALEAMARELDIYREN